MPPPSFYVTTGGDILANLGLQELHDFLHNTLQLKDRDYLFIHPDIELESTKTSFKMDFGENIEKNYKPIINAVQASLPSNITIPYNHIK